MFKTSAIFFLFITSYFCSGQTNLFLYSFGGGTSTLQGYTIFSSFSYERKHNEFTLRYNYNNQTGNSVPTGFFSSARYNDRFLDFSLLYGRTLRVKNWFMASASVGPAYYKYTDKSLGDPTYSYLGNNYSINLQVTNGLGLATQMEVMFILDQNFALSLNFIGCINGTQPIYGATFNLVFGILNEE